jgi:thiol-disulfide isomerase/thioredoxin
MKKSYLAIVLLSILAFAFTFQQKPSSDRLPDLPLTTTAGKKTNGKELKGKNILVVFLPDCDHCQREAVEIQKNLSKFKGYNLYFVSTADKNQLNKFAKDYKLYGSQDVYFAQTTGDGIRNSFGPISTPSVYIYSDKGKLVKYFIGETKIGEILKAI